MKATASQSKPPAVVLLSGGLDSYTAAAIAKSDGYALYALTMVSVMYMKLKRLVR